MSAVYTQAVLKFPGVDSKTIITVVPTGEIPARYEGMKRRRVFQVSNTCQLTLHLTLTIPVVLAQKVCVVYAIKDNLHRIDIDEYLNGKQKVNWIGCESCHRWFHQCCTELPKATDVCSINFVCFNCK